MINAEAKIKQLEADLEKAQKEKADPKKETVSRALKQTPEARPLKRIE